jgi:hypothetical protein
MGTALYVVLGSAMLVTGLWILHKVAHGELG